MLYNISKGVKYIQNSLNNYEIVGRYAAYRLGTRSAAPPKTVRMLLPKGSLK